VLGHPTILAVGPKLRSSTRRRSPMLGRGVGQLRIS
jgi:hypothetical protein